MPNKAYIKGRQKEYKIKKEYEKQGMICIRSAGSHSFADLVCILPTEKKIYFIQSKPNFSKKNLERLYKENEWLNDEFVCKYKVE